MSHSLFSILSKYAPILCLYQLQNRCVRVYCIVLTWHSDYALLYLHLHYRKCPPFLELPDQEIQIGKLWLSHREFQELLKKTTYTNFSDFRDLLFDLAMLTKREHYKF